MNLDTVLHNLRAWQKEHAGKTSGRCLEAVRHAVTEAGGQLPAPMARPNDTALGCYAELAAHPQKYGWQRWTHSGQPGETIPECLVFFRECGKLPDGRIAGHIAINDPNHAMHVSNESHPWTTWWSNRIVGCFVPEEQA